MSEYKVLKNQKVTKHTIDETNEKGVMYTIEGSSEIIHREDGPAIIRNGGVENGGSEFWVNNNKFHRDPEDGPAVQFDFGRLEWWFNNKLINTYDPTRKSLTSGTDPLECNTCSQKGMCKRPCDVKVVFD